MGAMLLLWIAGEKHRAQGRSYNGADRVRRRYGVSINRMPGDNGGMNA